jgi:hypothetical protein
MILTLVILSLLCVLIPALLFTLNLKLYLEPPAPPATELPAVSILIPARNEAAAIAGCLHAALTTRSISFEIVVMDDASTDATPDIVANYQRTAAKLTTNKSSLLSLPAIRLEQAPPLPPGWNGKQHACWALAQTARNPILCFVDADVRLAPGCISRMAAFLEASQSSLVSGFPRQITVTPLEWLLLPLIHFVLLGFLPISRMRQSTDPAFAAGCGQFLMCRRDDYFQAGSHSQIKSTMHDGLMLPKLFRQHGLRTDLADITSLATCRMYTSASQVWNGLAKNATEGLAAPARIVPITILLILGQIVPFAVLAWTLLSLTRALPLLWHHEYIFVIFKQGAALVVLLLVSLIAAYLPRILAAIRFRQSWRSALLHPIGILLLLAIQWYALIRKLLHAPITWRSRTYPEP